MQPVLVKRDGKAIPSQADVVENHSNGSAKAVVVRLIIDKLNKDASTELIAELGKRHKASPCAPGPMI